MPSHFKEDLLGRISPSKDYCSNSREADHVPEVGWFVLQEPLPEFPVKLPVIVPI